MAPVSFFNVIFFTFCENGKYGFPDHIIFCHFSISGRISTTTTTTKIAKCEKMPPKNETGAIVSVLNPRPYK